MQVQRAQVVYHRLGHGVMRGRPDLERLQDGYHAAEPRNLTGPLSRPPATASRSFLWPVVQYSLEIRLLGPRGGVSAQAEYETRQGESGVHVLRRAYSCCR